MKRGAIVLAMGLAVACKQKDIPYKPPQIEDAAAVPIDAPPPPADAALAARPRATKVVVGDHVTCAVMSDATVRCWGKNSDGQLGNGTTADSAVPVTVPLRGVTDVVLGTAHACALLDDTSVTCWGRINFGATGSLTKPTAVPGLQKAKRIFAVGTASCATLLDGPLVCWGDVDVRGMPRLSAVAPEHRAPTPVPDLDHITALAATGALSEDHTARWFVDKSEPKMSARSESSSDSRTLARTRPMDRVAIADVVEIAADADGLCGLRKDGTVACAGSRHCAWRKKTPVPAIEELVLPKAKHLAFDVGSCVITLTGKLQCLASKDGCQADDPWAGLSDVEAVSGNCARARSGAVHCWSVESNSRVVANVGGISRASSIAGSSSHVCALSTGEIICLGSNKHGALGRGEVDDRLHLDAKTVSF